MAGEKLLFINYTKSAQHITEKRNVNMKTYRHKSHTNKAMETSNSAAAPR